MQRNDTTDFIANLILFFGLICAIINIRTFFRNRKISMEHKDYMDLLKENAILKKRNEELQKKLYE